MPPEPITDLGAQLADAMTRLAELEAKVNPPKPKPFVPEPHRAWDPTANFSMPPQVVAEMARVGAETMGPVIADTRRTYSPRSEPSGPAYPFPAPTNRSGWVESRPLPAQPPGTRLVDRMIARQDLVDRYGEAAVLRAERETAGE